jgi:hypothetical protein
MKSKIIVALFIISCFFAACNQKTIEQKPIDLTAKIESDTLKITGYIIGYLNIDNAKFLIVDTIQIIKGINSENTGKINSINGELNGFITQNDAKDSTQLKILSGTKIVFQTLSYDSTGNFNFNEKLDYETFDNLVSSKEMERFRNIPFKFQINDGIILSIKEIYIP